MNLNNLLPRILGFVVIIVTLALGPTINTTNALITASNLTNCIGMSALDDFGAPLIILTLLFSGGILAIAGAKGRMSGTSIGSVLSVIGSVVLVIVALTLEVEVITYVNTLIAASSGTFATTIYGIIPLVIYIGIIAAAGYGGYQGARSLRGKGRGRKSASYANY